jgi:hypothetical protein
MAVKLNTFLSVKVVVLVGLGLFYLYIIFDNLLGRATEGMKENIDTDHSSEDHDLTNATIEDDSNTSSDSDKTSKKTKTKSKSGSSSDDDSKSATKETMSSKKDTKA